MELPKHGADRYATSRALFKKAKDLLPGGVNSPVRAFKGVGGTPPFITKGDGAYVFDVDGNRYLDFVGSWGPLIVGHTHPYVKEAVQKALDNGFSFGAPTEGEVELASLMVERVSGLEMVRLVNSGTEATMSAVRVARGISRRDRIIKFDGCYHGHADCFLIAAGSGTLDLGEPNSSGVPRSVAADTLVARYNDTDSVRTLLAAHPEEVAAVIVEPVGGNAGCIPPENTFLSDLRELCNQFGALLIFDEVMTGFRIARGGAAERYRVIPDLYTFGKVIGGGFPIGAYGGRADIMNNVAPVGAIYQAGTLSGNPIAVAAGKATLELLDDAAYDYLETLGQHIEDQFAQEIANRSWPLIIQRVGSMFSVFFTPNAVIRVGDATESNVTAFAKYFHGLLEDGFYIAPSVFECSFVSTAHTRTQIDEYLEAAFIRLESVFSLTPESIA